MLVYRRESGAHLIDCEVGGDTNIPQKSRKTKPSGERVIW